MKETGAENCYPELVVSLYSVLHLTIHYPLSPINYKFFDYITNQEPKTEFHDTLATLRFELFLKFKGNLKRMMLKWSIQPAACLSIVKTERLCLLSS